MFESLRDRIMALDESVIEKPTKMYVAYRVTNDFAEIMVGRSHLKIHLRPIEYKDPRGFVERIPDGYNWTLSRRVCLRAIADLEYVFGLGSRATLTSSEQARSFNDDGQMDV